jgi:uncharacterized protein (TIGR00297 family)
MTAPFLVLALLFAYLTVRRGSLTIAGSALAVALGALVVLRLGAIWLLPLLVFFLGSVAIERMFPGQAAAADEKDKRARDAVQVLCNGGVYGLLALVGAPGGLLLIAMAVATSDTWASAVGKYLRQPTYDMLRMRRVPVGLSGGVSIAGTLGGGAGALLIAGLGVGMGEVYRWDQFLLIGLYGWWGMLLDSVLGSAFQARYVDPEGKLSDRAGPGHQLVAGYGWMTNDIVNLLAIGLTVAFAATIL